MYIKNSRGITLLTTLISIFIILLIMGSTAAIINNTNAKREDSVIATNVSTLEDTARTYNSMKGSYPVKESIKLSKLEANDPVKLFFDAVVRISGKHPDVVDDRLKKIDLAPLLRDGYLSTKIEDEDYYILDKRNGKVYHIKQKASLTDLEELAKELLANAKDLTPGDPNFTGKGDPFDIEVTKNGVTYKMQNIIAMIEDGNRVILGGGCTETNPNCTNAIKVAVVNLTTLEDGTIKKEIVDLTEQVQADRNFNSVTELVVVGKNKVLVHYSDKAGKISNKIITIGG